MRILSLWRKPPGPVALRTRGVNRYARWARCTETVRGPFAGPPLGDHDLALTGLWASAQREWGLHVEVLNGPDGQPRVLAIAGAENIHPEWLVYPCGSGYQADESTDSTWSPTLEDALLNIGAMPKGGLLPSLPANLAGTDAPGTR